MQGFAGHWNKNSNLGQAFDVWFLNLFPRSSRFLYNEGGYLTLSFIPTLATMLLGLAAGRWFIASTIIPIRRFLVAAAILCCSGLLLHVIGICPIVKRVWTPSWVLWSGGLCFLLLAVFAWVADVRKQTRLVFPLLVVGVNSIAAYLMAHLCEDFILSSLRITLGPRVLNVLGTTLEPVLIGALILITYWLILHWMFRKKIFLRI